MLGIPAAMISHMNCMLPQCLAGCWSHEDATGCKWLCVQFPISDCHFGIADLMKRNKLVWPYLHTSNPRCQLENFLLENCSHNHIRMGLHCLANDREGIFSAKMDLPVSWDFSDDSSSLCYQERMFGFGFSQLTIGSEIWNGWVMGMKNVAELHQTLQENNRLQMVRGEGPTSNLESETYGSLT